MSSISVWVNSPKEPVGYNGKAKPVSRFAKLRSMPISDRIHDGSSRVTWSLVGINVDEIDFIKLFIDQKIHFVEINNKNFFRMDEVNCFLHSLNKLNNVVRTDIVSCLESLGEHLD